MPTTTEPTTVEIHRDGRGELYGYVGDAFVIAWPRFGAWSWSAIRTVDEDGERTETERIASGEGVSGASVAIAEAIDAAAKAVGLDVVGFEVSR